MGLVVLVPVSIALWLLCLLIPRTTAERNIPRTTHTAAKGMTSFLCGVKADDTDDEDVKTKTADAKPAWYSSVGSTVSSLVMCGNVLGGILHQNTCKLYV